MYKQQKKQNQDFRNYRMWNIYESKTAFTHGRIYLFKLFRFSLNLFNWIQENFTTTTDLI